MIGPVVGATMRALTEQRIPATPVAELARADVTLTREAIAGVDCALGWFVGPDVWPAALTPETVRAYRACSSATPRTIAGDGRQAPVRAAYGRLRARRRAGP